MHAPQPDAREVARARYILPCDGDWVCSDEGAVCQRHQSMATAFALRFAEGVQAGREEAAKIMTRIGQRERDDADEAARDDSTAWEQIKRHGMSVGFDGADAIRQATP